MLSSMVSWKLSVDGIGKKSSMNTMDNDDDNITLNVSLFETNKAKNIYSNNSNINGSFLFIVNLIDLPVPVCVNIFNLLNLDTFLESSVLSKQLQMECNNYPGIECKMANMFMTTFVVIYRMVTKVECCSNTVIWKLIMYTKLVLVISTFIQKR